MPSILDIPIEVFLDNILPIIPLTDLLHLACTCHFFATLIEDEQLWKHKIETDFNFSTITTARSSGWKFIYKGLEKPKLFVWGDPRNGRLGLEQHDPYSVPYPVELCIPHARIVSLAAGGWSFHALDSIGRSYVWGALDGEYGALTSDGYDIPGKSAPTPLRLELPVSLRTISCGRAHTMALDTSSNVWLFCSWGLPRRLVSSLLDCSSSFSTPSQAECGWTFSAVLTQEAGVYVFWPFSAQMATLLTSWPALVEGAERPRANEGVLHCTPMDLPLEPFRLPDLPLLPDIDEEANSRNEPTRIVSIAGLNNSLVALTNKGHVLKFDHLEDMDSASSGRWTYLPKFSESERVKQHPVFVPKEGYDLPAPPVKIRITHVTASFQHFFASSTVTGSIVLMGNVETTAESEPTVNPALQNKSIISVVVGDYHCGALTATGKLITWGKYSRGALGLGDPTKKLSRRVPPPQVDVPTEVRFYHGSKRRKDTFCFAAAACGWHTGALVIDLDPDDSEEESELVDDPATRMPGALPVPPPQPPFIHYGPGNIPMLRGRGVFRIGFAGRGMYRGGSQG